MKTVLFAIALLTGSAAMGQISAPAPTALESGQVMLAGNDNPERDAHNVPVISAPAAVPAGYNGTPADATGTGGPLIDPADAGATAVPSLTPDATYRACSRTVTDNCVQLYERGRRRR
ncbi:MAG TPA: hypothetical protein VIT38_13105 [Allosphingosinicella sp.]|jgi:hypothetical protein